MSHSEMPARLQELPRDMLAFIRRQVIIAFLGGACVGIAPILWACTPTGTEAVIRLLTCNGACFAVLTGFTLERITPERAYERDLAWKASCDPFKDEPPCMIFNTHCLNACEWGLSGARCAREAANV